MTAVPPCARPGCTAPGLPGNTPGGTLCADHELELQDKLQRRNASREDYLVSIKVRCCGGKLLGRLVLVEDDGVAPIVCVDGHIGFVDAVVSQVGKDDDHRFYDSLRSVRHDLYELQPGSKIRLQGMCRHEPEVRYDTALVKLRALHRAHAGGVASRDQSVSRVEFEAKRLPSG